MPWPTTGRADRGAVELELVIVVPVLMMIVLFVVWAGRVGNAGLAAELAAEEAAVAAALSEPESREAAARAVVESRPDLDYLCVGGPAPIVGDTYVTEVLRDFQNTAGVARGIGLVGVALRCETDGAVPVLRGLAPTVVHYGRGSEPFIVAGAADLPTLLTPDIAVPEGPTQQYFQTDLTPRTVLLELSLDRPAVGRPVNIVATTEQITTAQIDNPQIAAVTDDWCSPRAESDRPDGVPEACGGTAFGNGGCHSSPGGAGFFDYSETSFSGIIVEGEQRISFPVTIIDDCIDENDERFRVSLEVDGASLENPAAPHFDVIIEDNDPTPLVAFAFDEDSADRLANTDDCGAFQTSAGAAGWRLGEDKGAADCAEAYVTLQLRYATDPADTLFMGRPVLGLSGRPGSFVVEGRGAPLGGRTAAPAAIGACPADFNLNEISISFAAASGEYTGGLLKQTTTVGNVIGGYNEFKRDKYPKLALKTAVLDDEIDERTEHFTLNLRGFSNVAGPGPTAAPGTDTSGGEDFQLFPTMRVEIIDDESPGPQSSIPPGPQSSIPWLSATPGAGVSRDTSTPPNYSIDRSTLNTDGIPIKFEVARPPPPTPSVASQGVSDTQGLPIGYQITVHYSDDPLTTSGAADPGSRSWTPAAPPANFIAPCESSGTGNALAPIGAQVRPFIDGDVITSIEFSLLPGPSWPQPSHPMYRIDPAHSDFTVTVNSVP